MLRDGFGNLSEIDVVYGIFRRRYVECKAYHDGHHVPLADVAKFKEVLQLNGISPRRGLFVTTSDYVPRAKVIGIKVIDGKQLKRLERLWPLYRLGRIALTGAASMAALLLIDDFIASKVSLEAYAKRFTHFDYAENLYRRAPTRFERITQQANNLCRETFKKFF